MLRRILLKRAEKRDKIKKCYEQDVRKLITINSGKRFEVWKYFEDNAQKLQSTVWDQAKWLLAIQGGVLFLPFTARLIKPIRDFPFMETKVLPEIIIMYFFGIILSIYSLLFQRKTGDHIARNFDRAIWTRDGELGRLSSRFRIPILQPATWLFIAAFLLIPYGLWKPHVLLQLKEFLSRL